MSQEEEELDLDLFFYRTSGPISRFWINHFRKQAGDRPFTRADLRYTLFPRRRRDDPVK